MKKKLNFFILLLICSLLLTSSFLTNASIGDLIGDPKLNVDTTPPVIIFNTTLMESDGVLKILVYDIDSGLASVDVYHNSVLLLDSLITFNVTWFNYTLPVPLSREYSFKSSSDAYEANLSTDIFVPGIHNDVYVESENLEGGLAGAFSFWCDTVHCWGGGGYTGNTDVDTFLAVPSGTPIIEFNMTCYFECGRIEPTIDGNGAVIENFTISIFNDILYAEVIVGSETFVAGVALSDVDLEYIGAPDCPECEICEECIETPYPIIPVLVAFVVSVSILTLRKRKK